MIIEENNVELVSFHGGDLLHTSSMEGYILEGHNQTEKTNRFLTYLYENSLLGNFRKSYLQFKLNTDYTTYINFCKTIDARNITNKIYKQAEGHWKDSRVKYFIPQDFTTCVTSSDIIDEEGNILYEKGTNYFDLINDFNRLGVTLHTFIKNDMKKKLPILRTKNASDFFLTLSTQVTYDITLNFIEFVEFYNTASSPYAQQEYQHIASLMLELIKGIKYNPFKTTIKLFNL